MALLTLFLTHAPEKQEFPSVFTVRMVFSLHILLCLDISVL